MTASQCYLFRGLKDAEIEKLAAFSENAHIGAGQWLFHKGDRAGAIYLVEEGAVELLIPVNPDIEIPVSLIRPGNGCVGVGALLKPYTYTLSGRCKEDSRLTVIASADLMRLFESDPDIGRTVMANLAQRLIERLRETREEIKLHFLNLIQAETFS